MFSPPEYFQTSMLSEYIFTRIIITRLVAFVSIVASGSLTSEFGLYCIKVIEPVTLLTTLNLTGKSRRQELGLTLHRLRPLEVH